MSKSSPSDWPPSSGLCSPTVPREDAVLQSAGSCHINAPAALVFGNVLYVAKYPEWNHFVPEAQILSGTPSPPELTEDELEAEGNGSGHMKKDDIIVFQVVMNSNKPKSYRPTQLQVTDISTPDRPSAYIDRHTLESDPAYTSDLSKVYRISWKSHGGWVSKGLRTERFHEIIILGDNECELRTWEVYGGLLAHTVKWLYQQTLDEKFQLWCDDLKKYSEQMVTGSAKA